MNFIVKTSLFLTALLPLGAFAQVTAENPVVFTARAQQPTAVFMTLKNDGKRTVSLVMADSAESRLELHGMQNGVMAAVNGIEIPPQGTVQLKRGGLHIMVFDVATDLNQGDKLPLTLYFDNGEILSVEALTVSH